MELFLYAFAALFSIINPLGTVPIFVGLTQEEDLTERKKTALLTAINVLVILMISLFLGKYLLQLFGISLNSLRIAGGVIIVSSGFALLTGSFAKHKGMKNKRVQKDLSLRERFSLTPLAIPMLAGPGSISLLITFQQEYGWTQDVLYILAAVILVCLTTFLILRSSYLIVKTLGASGINAISRIIGFIVIAIGIEYISGSVVDLMRPFL
jgi:multiple antibiotic resistance protein